MDEKTYIELREEVLILPMDPIGNHEPDDRAVILYVPFNEEGPCFRATLELPKHETPEGFTYSVEVVFASGESTSTSHRGISDASGKSPMNAAEALKNGLRSIQSSLEESEGYRLAQEFEREHGYDPDMAEGFEITRIAKQKVADRMNDIIYAKVSLYPIDWLWRREESN